MNTRQGHKTLAQHPDLQDEFSRLVNAFAQKDFRQNIAELGHRVDRFTMSVLHGLENLESVLDIISFLNEQLSCRIIQSAEKAVQQRFKTDQSRPFCWINMGSDARQEQVVRTDQDNAIIYADPAHGDQVETDLFFKGLATQVVEDLEVFGFKKCRGNVMATNPDWRRSLGSWNLALEEWVGSSEPEDVRKLTILLDFRPIYGDIGLARKIQSRVFELFSQTISVSHYLTRDDSLFESPMTLFGHIRTRRMHACKNCFNIKTSGLAHLINAIRILAVNNRIKVPSTLARMKRLQQLKVLSIEEFSACQSAFNLLMTLKINNHLKRRKGEALPVNCIDLAGISPGEKQALSQALTAVKALQKRISKQYNVAWMNFFN